MKCENGIAIADALEHATIAGRNIWLYLIETTIGNIYIVQHENRDDPYIIDDYMGYNKDKAFNLFRRTCRKMSNWIC